MVTREKKDINKGEESERVNDNNTYVYTEKKRNIETTTRDINSPFMYKHTYTHTHTHTQHQPRYIDNVWVSECARARARERERDGNDGRIT